MQSANVTYWVIVRNRKCWRIDWSDDRPSYYMEVEHPWDPSKRIERQVSSSLVRLRAEIDAAIACGKCKTETWGI